MLKRTEFTVKWIQTDQVLSLTTNILFLFPFFLWFLYIITFESAVLKYNWDVGQLNLPMTTLLISVCFVNFLVPAIHTNGKFHIKNFNLVKNWVVNYCVLIILNSVEGTFGTGTCCIRLCFYLFF